MSAARAVGALLLVVSGWCAGGAVQASLTAHEDELRRALELLRRVQSEIGYRRADLDSIAEQLRREGMLPPQTGALRSLAPPPTFSRREAECFAECVAGLGRAPAEAECERLGHYIRRFEEYLSEASDRARRCAPLTRRLGLAAGAVAALMVA